MLNENAKKWVAALRSGKYEQCEKKLTFDGGFCCLGVACMVASESGVLLPDTWDSEASLLSLPSVKGWLGLDCEFGSYVTEEGYRGELTDDNDSGKTFAQIADIIESEPKGLFVDTAVANG